MVVRDNHILIMKRIFKFVLIALLAVSAGSCTKDNSADEKFQPVEITGVWAVSQLYDGSSWKNNSIREVMVFDGNGSYYLKKYTGQDRVTYTSGVIDADESMFVREDGSPDYTATYAGDQYSFSSFGTSQYILTRKSGTSLEFTTRKLEKVNSFIPKKPDPEPGDEINGTKLLEGNDIVGLITDASTGKGIPGIPVSDGYSLVRTDANGVYQFAGSNDTGTTPKVTRYVFYSTPSEYRIETVDGIPCFYKNLQYVPGKGRIRTDWTLKPLEKVEKKWTFVGIGDTQCGSTSEIMRYKKETIVDMKEYLPKFENPYGVVLGDITHDSNGTWSGMKSSMENIEIAGRVMPFFQVMGNHDHNALVDNAYASTQLYNDNFGPENYSFNIGDVHIVCFDNVLVTKREVNTGKANGWTWSEYNSGMSDICCEWFKKDIDCVSDKADKMLILCVHIPFNTSAPKHRTDIMNFAKQFKEVHIMAGHTHYNINYIHSNYVTKSGLPVYEHVHGAACGAWWESGSSINTTGAPAGYTVYSIDGAGIVDWKMKGSQKDEDHQFRVYDGNQTYNGTKGYSFNWYKTDNKGGSSGIVCKGYNMFKNAFVVEVFDDDNKYVKVEMYQKGLKVGDFTRVSAGASANICACSYLFNERSKNSTTWNSTASPFWYFTSTNPIPSEVQDWEVRMTRTIPGSGKENVYKVTKFTSDYTDFKRTIY